VRWWAVSLAIVGVVFAFVVTPASGQVLSNECCTESWLPIGARSVSLGQALTARASRDGFFYNPASIAGYGKIELVGHNETGPLSTNSAISLLFDAGLAGTFGLTWVRIDEGESEAREDPDEVTGILSHGAHIGILSYGFSVGAGLRAGASIRVYYGGTFCKGDCLGGEAARVAPLFDLGVQYRLLPSLELGAAITHLGPDLIFRNAAQADPTPARFRAGAAYEVAHHIRPDSLVTVWLSADIVYRLWSPTSTLPAVGVGLELSIDRMIHLRAGYSGSGDGLAFGGGGLGIGINFRRFTIDITRSFTPLAPEGEPYLISVGFTF
jgi:hypothetical protein